MPRSSVCADAGMAKLAAYVKQVTVSYSCTGIIRPCNSLLHLTFMQLERMHDNGLASRRKKLRNVVVGGKTFVQPA